MFRNKWQLTLTIAFLCLGLLFSLQFRTHKAMDNDLNFQSNETLAAISRDLNTKYYQLIQEVWDLRTQLRLLEQSNDQNKLLVEALKREQQKLNIATGLTPVEGPGLIITIPENNQNYLGYQDIIDIVNELWNANAEAISVNSIRVTGATSFLPSDELSTILMDGKKLSYPYVIKAIGEPSALEKGISIPKGVIDYLRNLYKIPLEIKQADKVSLPSASAPNLKYSYPVAGKTGEKPAASGEPQF